MIIDKDDFETIPNREKTYVPYRGIKIQSLHGRFIDYIGVDQNEEVIKLFLEARPSNTMLAPGYVSVIFKGVAKEFVFDKMPQNLSKIIFSSKKINFAILNDGKLDFYIDVEDIIVFSL
jgi:hypothetical protein